jgi:hypothetical protein
MAATFSWRPETAAVIDSDRFEFLTGDVSGLRAVIMALVNSHPDPRALIREIDRLAELQAASANPMPVTEPFIRGQTQTTDTFRARILEILTRGGRR